MQKITTCLWFDTRAEQGTRGLVENLVKYLQN